MPDTDKSQPKPEQTVTVQQSTSLFTGCMLIMIWTLLAVGAGYVIRGWVM